MTDPSRRIPAVLRDRSRLFDGTLGDRCRWLGRVVFGDRVALALFLGALFVFTLWWRVDVLITDTNTIANTLVNVAEGHLHLERTPYGTGYDPGTVAVDGVRYGRNYGQVAFALPFYWLLRGASATVGIQPAIVGLSVGCLAGAGYLAGRLLGRPRVGTGAGVAALAFLALNLWVGRGLTIADSRLAVAALQLSTMVAAASVGVFLYRLLARMYDRRIGLFAGATAVVATPVGFWATIPKRHALVTAIVVVAVYAFYRSRSATDAASLGPTGFRAIAWACAGLLAWVHVEALALVIALAVVDVPTAPSNRPTSLAVVAGAFLLGLLPTLLTNVSLSGNPFAMPYMLPRASEVALAGATETASTATAATAESAGGTAAAAQPPDGAQAGARAGGEYSGSGLFAALVRSLGDVAETVFGRYADGLHALASDPTRFVHVFVYSVDFGFGQDRWLFMGGGTNLSVLESAPVAGGVVGFVAAGARRLSGAAGDGVGSIRSAIGSVRGWTIALRDDGHAVDLFVLVFVAVHTLPYLARLPLKVQITNRYLLPTYAILVYLICRHPAVRRVVRNKVAHVGYTVQATVLLGIPALYAGLLVSEYTLGEAFQFHGKLALALAGLLGVAIAASTFRDRADAATGVALGLAIGATTVFFSAVAIFYWPYGPAVLPLLERAIAQLRHLLIVF